MFFKARKVLQEMSNDDEIGRKIRKAMKSQLKIYRRTIKQGKYRHLTVFEVGPESGWQYYFEGDDWSKNIMGFKMGPLRAVQRKLDILTADYLRIGVFTAEDLAVSLPTNTIERIEFFAQMGQYPLGQAESLGLSYLWFLREYHRVQEKFKNSPKYEVVSTKFNSQEFNMNLAIINSFLHQ